MRTVVVGASTGLGRCIGVGLAGRGAQVALLARRYELLADAVKQAGPGALAISCDVTDEAACQAAIDTAAGGLGGIDAVVYAAGIGVLSPIEKLDAASWSRCFATNVTGAAMITAAALPYLRQSRGAVAYLTSTSASLTPPWPGLAAYAASKAALDKMVDAWRAEHADIGFTRVIVGECPGGEGHGVSHFMDDFDPDLAGKLISVWLARGLMASSLLDVEDLVGVVDAVLRAGASASVPSVAVLPRQQRLEV
jgi:NAD(P)-dependent dehydrogenase (short-subunit alcohol dehydrogenase family)